MNSELTITVQYSCKECGLNNVPVQVPVRKEESAIDWVDSILCLLSTNHHQLSPMCHPKTLQNIKIPLNGTAKIGGPVIQ